MNFLNSVEVVKYLEANALWISQCFAVIFISLLLDFFQRRLTRRVAKTLQSTSNIWDDALLEAMRRPLSVLIWVIGVSFAIDIIVAHTQTSVFGFVGDMRNLLVHKK